MKGDQKEIAVAAPAEPVAKLAPQPLSYMRPVRVDRWRILKHLGFIVAIMVPAVFGILGIVVVIVGFVSNLNYNLRHETNFFALLIALVLASLFIWTANLIREEYGAARWRWRNAEQWS